MRDLRKHRLNDECKNLFHNRADVGIHELDKAGKYIPHSLQNRDRTVDNARRFLSEQVDQEVPRSAQVPVCEDALDCASDIRDCGHDFVEHFNTRVPEHVSDNLSHLVQIVPQDLHRRNNQGDHTHDGKHFPKNAAERPQDCAAQLLKRAEQG